MKKNIFMLAGLLLSIGSAASSTQFQLDQKLITAAASGDLTTVKNLLMIPEINVNAVDNSNATALIHAAYNDYLPVVNELLIKKSNIIDLTIIDTSSCTALSAAAYAGLKPIVQRLLAASGTMSKNYFEQALTKAFAGAKTNGRDSLQEISSLIYKAAIKKYPSIKTYFWNLIETNPFLWEFN